MKRVIKASIGGNISSDLMKLDNQISEIMNKLSDLPDDEWDKFSAKGGVDIYNSLHEAHGLITAFWDNNWR